MIFFIIISFFVFVLLIHSIEFSILTSIFVVVFLGFVLLTTFVNLEYETDGKLYRGVLAVDWLYSLFKSLL
ncbi:hypothetical protein F5879DRAFT_980703 [Lentinula edodes]|nr:hypothetical protein F5879DRAFT_980703 [Lentinula edodes]